MNDRNVEKSRVAGHGRELPDENFVFINGEARRFYSSPLLISPH